MAIIWQAGAGSAFNDTTEAQLREKFPRADDATMLEAMRYVHARCRLAVTGDGVHTREKSKNYVNSWRD